MNGAANGEAGAHHLEVNLVISGAADQVVGFTQWLTACAPRPAGVRIDPLLGRGEAPPAAPANPAAATGEATVLIASDAAAAVAAWLPLLGAEPTLSVEYMPATDAEALVRRVALCRPRCLVVDEHLLAGDPAEWRLLRRLREAASGLRVLLLCAHVGPAVRDRVLRLRLQGALPVDAPAAECLGALRAATAGSAMPAATPVARPRLVSAA